MQMKDSEIIRRYKQADKKREQIKILAELNACTKEDIRQILREAGCDVPATGNRYTVKKALDNAAAAGEESSKKKQAKLTEKGKRLLKNEEPAESSDLSAPTDVGTCQQNVGTMSETVDDLRECYSDAEMRTGATHAAPTACQPAEPVDVWSEIFDEQMDKQAEETKKATQKHVDAWPVPAEVINITLARIRQLTEEIDAIRDSLDSLSDEIQTKGELRSQLMEWIEEYTEG